MTVTVEVPQTLSELARVVVPHLREVFGPDLSSYQTLALAEEAGEFVGAYRRWAGMARRNGSWQDVCDELADVIITAYVTAEVNGLKLRHPLPPPRLSTTDAYFRVLDVYAAVGEYVEAKLFLQADPEIALGRVVGATRGAARALNIELEAAWRSKAERILARGWKE